MKKLKVQEEKILNYLIEWIAKNGYAPSVRDIMAAMGYKSTSTVHLYLHRLDELGYIRMEDGKSRAISLGEGTMRPGVPILGKVTAGIPVLAAENFDGYLNFTPEKGRYSVENLFALRISGNSMIGVGILDGDFVVVEKGDYAENGDVVVAMIEDEATVKTFYKEGKHFRLQPENPSFEPIVTDSLAILGRVVASVRYY